MLSKGFQASAEMCELCIGNNRLCDWFRATVINNIKILGSRQIFFVLRKVDGRILVESMHYVKVASQINDGLGPVVLFCFCFDSGSVYCILHA
jgi:hypothetical protein